MKADDDSGRGESQRVNRKFYQFIWAVSGRIGLKSSKFQLDAGIGFCGSVEVDAVFQREMIQRKLSTSKQRLF